MGEGIYLLLLFLFSTNIAAPFPHRAEREGFSFLYVYMYIIVGLPTSCEVFTNTCIFEYTPLMICKYFLFLMSVGGSSVTYQVFLYVSASHTEWGACFISVFHSVLIKVHIYSLNTYSPRSIPCVSKVNPNASCLVLSSLSIFIDSVSSPQCRHWIPKGT